MMRWKRVEVIADTLGRSVEHSLLAFHDSALCLSNEVAVRGRVEDIHFNSSSVRLRLHHSSYLHVTYTLHVARENPIEGNPISTLSKPETYGKCHNIPMLL